VRRISNERKETVKGGVKLSRTCQCQPCNVTCEDSHCPRGDKEKKVNYRRETAVLEISILYLAL
jgi:hypothetical protein